MDGLTTVVVFIVIICCHTVEGGICWLSKTKNGRCRQIYSLKMSRERCCRLPFPTVSWTPHRNVTRADIFYWAAFRGGAPQCQICHGTCKNVKCGQDRKCRVRRGQARCVCSPYCPRFMKLQGVVCGSDRRSYRNYCAMLRHNCRYNREVRLSYFGRCKESCSDVKCYNPHHYCLRDQDGLPHCVYCNTHCPNHITSNICGEDGNTYGSYCHLVAAICMKGQAIRVAYKGACKANASCSMLQCPTGYKCLVNTTSGLPQCSNCRVTCPSSMPISDTYLCGTDDITYNGYCAMQETACDTGIVIKTAYYGRCQARLQNISHVRKGTPPSWGQVTNIT